MTSDPGRRFYVAAVFQEDSDPGAPTWRNHPMDEDMVIVLIDTREVQRRNINDCIDRVSDLERRAAVLCECAVERMALLNTLDFLTETESF